MAAPGDIVSPNIRVGENPAPLLAQPPQLGLVVTVDGNTAPDRIVWYSTREAAPTFAALADATATLDVIQAPVNDLSGLVGRVVRRITDPAGADASGGTSREYDAVVLSAYSRDPLDSGAPDPADFLLVKTIDGGLWIEDRAERFVVASDR